MGMKQSLEQTLDRLRQGPAWNGYLEVRDQVLRYLDQQGALSGGHADPSTYWAEELAGFEYLFDASPLLIDKLRHHTFHVTGLKVYDYRTGKDEARAAMAAKLAMLEELAGNRDLLVPEAPELGGFGHDIDGTLCNIDTLKFWEVMIGLERGGVLPAMRESTKRNVVVEIGSGWGGFARVFKTLVPNTTYVMIDLPQTMLFSGTYLRGLMPEAKVLFVDPTDPPAPETYLEHDFVFLPHYAAERLAPPHLNLFINMVSFQEMTGDQVRDYVALAKGLDAEFLYSLNRDRSPYNRELESVSEIIAEHFSSRDLEMLPLPYTRMPNPDGTIGAKKKGDKKAKKKKVEEGTAVGKPFRATAYRHILGWRKA